MKMSARTTFVSIVSSLLLAAAFAASGCGPEESNVNQPVEDTGGTTSDTGVDADEPEPDGGPSDTMDADDGLADGDQTEDGDGMTDAGDTGGGDGGLDEQAVFVATSSNFTDDKKVSNAYAAGASLSGVIDGVDTNIELDTNALALDNSGGRVYLLDQRCAFSSENCPIDNGTVHLFDVSDPAAAQTTHSYDLQFDTGQQTINRYNPRGVGRVASSGKLYATAYSATALFEYESEGAASLIRDLGQFHSAETPMGAATVAVDGKFVAVTLQRYRNQQSKLAVYDTANEKFVDFDNSADGVQALGLQYKNVTSGPSKSANGDWTFGAVGKRTDMDQNLVLDGGIVELDRAGAGDYSVGEMIVSEEQLGGNLKSYVLTGASAGIAVVSDASFVSHVKRFSVSGGNATVEELKVLNAGGSLCMSPDGSTVWVGDAKNSPEFYGYDTSSWEQVESSPLVLDGAATPTGCAFVEK